MTNSSLARFDDGAMNARILAKAAKADFRRVEAPSVKMLARLYSGGAKRLFVRFFNSYQLSMYVISDLARFKLPPDEIARIEDELQAQLATTAYELNQAKDGIEASFKTHGIFASDQATCDVIPLEIIISVYSPFGRRYLEIIEQFDQLILMWRTQFFHGVCTRPEIEKEQLRYQRMVRQLTHRVRVRAAELRRRMNALEAWKVAQGRRPAVSSAGATESSSGPVTSQVDTTPTVDPESPSTFPIAPLTPEFGPQGQGDEPGNSVEH